MNEEEKANQQVLGHDLEWNFMDAALRMLTVSEFQNSQAGFKSRWRHFLPSFWAIIAPVLVEWNWCCYVWDFQDKNLTVLDPTRMDSSPAEIAEAHNASILSLHDALFDCKNTFFRGWNVSREDWSLKCKVFPGFGGP
ncbi:hypothetical protein EJB05_39673, partial [Eragrostis curvula]